MIRDNCDFFRAAVFDLITPRLAALSIALYAAGRASFADLASFPATKVLIVLTASRIVRRRRSLNTFLRADCRTDFFCALIIGIIYFVRKRMRLMSCILTELYFLASKIKNPKLGFLISKIIQL